MDNFDLKITAVYYSVNYKERIYGLKKTTTKGVVCLGCGLWIGAEQTKINNKSNH